MWRAGRTGLPEVLRVSDSSPDSAETSFRELDDVFLQTQTRIWLGEVLHVWFDEGVVIADLLADGEMLFQVSKKVWKMLLKKHGELNHSKVYIYERTSSGKIDWRYMPYPKVDSFLKICQILGLTGIDLFSPSDVVEKRDTRRVCMCIRSLSKKARSKQLNVPDFDIVTHAIAMPTNLVGGIRRCLELSQFCSSRSSCRGPSNDAAETCGQKARYDSGSEETDSIFSDLDSLYGDDFLLPKLETPVGKFICIGGDDSNKQVFGKGIQFDLSIVSIELDASSPSSSESSVEAPPSRKNCISLSPASVLEHKFDEEDERSKGRRQLLSRDFDESIEAEKKKTSPVVEDDQAEEVRGRRKRGGEVVMKSVAGVVTVAGALAVALFFGLRQRGGRERSDGGGSSSEFRKKTRWGVFTVKLYPGEKFRF